VYHDVNQPPAKAGVCDRCGSQLTQRDDDRAEVVARRIDIQAENLQPLLDYYASKVCEVDGERDADAVTTDLGKCIAR
jgi:adenylate kinase